MAKKQKRNKLHRTIRQIGSDLCEICRLLGFQNPISIKSALILIISFSIPAFIFAQSEENERRFHTGVYFQLYGASQTYQYELASSVTKPGVAFGLYEHFDVSQRLQLRIGCAYSLSTLLSKDYSPLFPNDYDPSTGQVDVYKSYVLNEVSLRQVFLPLHVRYKLGNASKHFFLAGGLEFRIVTSEKYDARIFESGVNVLEFDTRPFYKSRNPNLAAHFEFGYELPLKSKKLNVSVLSKYGMGSQIEGEGQAFYGLYKGHALDLGLSTELIF